MASGVPRGSLADEGGARCWIEDGILVGRGLACGSTRERVGGFVIQITLG